MIVGCRSDFLDDTDLASFQAAIDNSTIFQDFSQDLEMVASPTLLTSAKKHHNVIFSLLSI